MNIAAIQTFLTVNRLRTLNRAAEQLNITQSAVTARLDTLEAALGTRLLNRSRNGATLTKAGYAFLDQAELIVQTWSNAQSQASLPRGVTALFSLVCDPSLWSSHGAVWIRDLRDAHPDTAFEIWAGGPSDARRWLQAGLSDAALLSEPLTGPDLSHRLFAREALVEVATQRRDALPWDPLYVMVDYGPSFRTQHAAAWPAENTAQISFSTPDWALSHLLENGGSAYLPERLVQSHLRDGTLHRVHGATAFERECHLSWRRPAEAAFPWVQSIAETA